MLCRPQALLALSTLLLSPCLIAQTQPPPAVQIFPLTDTIGLTAQKATVKAIEYQGRKAVLVAPARGNADGFAFLPGTDFQDGTIEADIALKITTPPGVRMPGFIGIAFRARPDASHYDMFYVRPGNSHSPDQAMRNHSVQYVEGPDFGWYKLRREFPFVYESYADLKTESWIRMKIEVSGRDAKLYLNGSGEASLVVHGLRGEDLRGSVALWGYQGEEAYFSNVRITNAKPAPISNGSDATGTWQVKYASDAGLIAGSLKLTRNGNNLTGTWSGDLGSNLAVQGTWRNGYVELTFPCTWMKETAQVTAHLEGWIDGNSAQGRMVVEGRADGPWTAAKQ